MPFLIRRIFETILLSAVCSVPFKLLTFYNILSDEFEIALVAIISLALFIYGNVFFLSRYLCAVRNIGVYFTVNSISYFLYLFFTYFVLFYFGGYIGWLAMPVLALFWGGIPKIISLSAIHLIMVAIIIIVPRYQWYFDSGALY